MKGRNLIFLSILVTLGGVALLLFRDSIASGAVVTVGGVLFILAGLFNVVAFDYSRKRVSESGERKGTRGPVSTAMSWVSSVAAVILGICMLVFKPTFMALVPVMFGILVAFAAFYQLYILAVGVRPVVLPAWLYIAPLLLAGAAAYLFFLKDATPDSTIVLITAISIIVFGVAGLFEGIMLGSENHLMKKEGASTPDEARMLRQQRLEAKEAAESKPEGEDSTSAEADGRQSHDQAEPTEPKAEKTSGTVDGGVPLDE